MDNGAHISSGLIQHTDGNWYIKCTKHEKALSEHTKPLKQIKTILDDASITNKDALAMIKEKVNKALEGR